MVMNEVEIWCNNYSEVNLLDELRSKALRENVTRFRSWLMKSKRDATMAIVRPETRKIASPRPELLDASPHMDL